MRYKRQTAQELTIFEQFSFLFHSNKPSAA